MDETSKGRFELRYVLVVHSDADGEGRWPFTQLATGVDFREQASLLDVTSFTVCTESCTPDLGIEVTLGQHHGLVGGATRLLPLDLAQRSV